jgi:hypothetical protein
MEPLDTNSTSSVADSSRYEASGARRGTPRRQFAPRQRKSQEVLLQSRSARGDSDDGDYEMFRLYATTRNLLILGVFIFDRRPSSGTLKDTHFQGNR